MIKKFIATAARQKVSNSPGYYEAVNNPDLRYDIPNSYPVLPMIHAYVEPGDEVELIIIRMEPEDEQGRATAKENAETMERLARELSETKNASSFRTVDFTVPDDEQIDTHLNIFERLISEINGEDCIYVDVTYGTKTQMLALVLAVNYTYQAVPGAQVACVVYGNYNFQTYAKKIYDITLLFLMDQIVNRVAAIRHPDPARVIRTILDHDRLPFAAEETEEESKS